MSQFTDFEDQVDLSQVQEFGGSGGGPALPPGEYMFDLVGFEKGTSSKNQPVYKVTVSVVEALSGDTSLIGKQLQQSYSAQQQALGRIKQLGKAVGARMDRIASADYIGGRFYASIVHNEGGAAADQAGNPLPPRIFANIANERPLEDATPAPAPTPPPVTRKATTPAARRA
jgi:hypothetical protein